MGEGEIMKLFIVSLLCWSLIVPPIMAADVCAQPVQPLNMGQSAPCTGFLFSPAKEKQVRLINDDYSFTKQEVDVLSKQKVFLQSQLNDLQGVVNDQKKEINIWRLDDINNSQKLVKVEEGRGTRDALFFGGGVLAALVFALIANSLRH